MLIGQILIIMVNFKYLNQNLYLTFF